MGKTLFLCSSQFLECNKLYLKTDLFYPTYHISVMYNSILSLHESMIRNIQLLTSGKLKKVSTLYLLPKFLIHKSFNLREINFIIIIIWSNLIIVRIISFYPPFYLLNLEVDMTRWISLNLLSAILITISRSMIQYKASYWRNWSINLSIFIYKFTNFNLSRYYRRSLMCRTLFYNTQLYMLFYWLCEVFPKLRLLIFININRIQNPGLRSSVT